uniref:Uncharacterized protein n=1 Tax=Oryza barthii TaxID=65489 RepID=A0A0D3HK89_9ORYZ
MSASLRRRAFMLCSSGFMVRISSFTPLKLLLYCLSTRAGSFPRTELSTPVATLTMRASQMPGSRRRKSFIMIKGEVVGSCWCY